MTFFVNLLGARHSKIFVLYWVSEDIGKSDNFLRGYWLLLKITNIWHRAAKSPQIICQGVLFTILWTHKRVLH
jgi:hypothetical protein